MEGRRLDFGKEGLMLREARGLNARRNICCALRQSLSIIEHKAKRMLSKSLFKMIIVADDDCAGGRG